MKIYKCMLYMGLQYSIMDISAESPKAAIDIAIAKYGAVSASVDDAEYSGAVPAAVWHGDF